MMIIHFYFASFPRASPSKKRLQYFLENFGLITRVYLSHHHKAHLASPKDGRHALATTRLIFRHARRRDYRRARPRDIDHLFLTTYTLLKPPFLAIFPAIIHFGFQVVFISKEPSLHAYVYRTSSERWHTGTPCRAAHYLSLYYATRISLFAFAHFIRLRAASRRMGHTGYRTAAQAIPKLRRLYRLPMLVGLAWPPFYFPLLLSSPHELTYYFDSLSLLSIP